MIGRWELIMKTLVISAAIVGAVVSASAQATLYDNGPINGTAAWIINDGYAVSDSFALANAATIGAITVGLWEPEGGGLASLDWSITTSALGGTTLASGTASSFTTVYAGPTAVSYDLYSETFSVNAALAAGNYWLQLDNADTSPGGYTIAWDENDGPSSAVQTNMGALPGSESFALTAVPEPTTLALSALGAASLLIVRRRRAEAPSMPLN